MPKKKEIIDSVEISSNKIDSKVDTNLGSIYNIKWRHYFTDDKSILEIPELIEVQLNSYKEFLETKLNKAFEESFPICDFSWEKIDIYYKSMTLEEPKADRTVADCKRKNLNYEAPLKIRLEMLNKETWEIKEQDVYMWWIPLMTPMGSFIINGIERVIVSQVIRSTWMFFSPDSKNPWFFAMKFIPQKWSWFEIELEKKWVINVKIDKKRKIPITTLMRAYWLETDNDIIGAFKSNKEFIAKYIWPTIEKDKTKTKLEALHAIYKLLRPGDLGTDERVQDLFNNTFFEIKKFDLWEIARIKINRKLWLNVEYKDDWKFLQLNDLVLWIHYLLNLIEWKEWYNWDDIDHLENRRVRSVWELVYDKIKIGLVRMEKIAKDRMTIVELEDATPGTFINSRPLTAVLKEFFASSQLSQFMDQSNPVSELAHKRIITALWPGWLTRERASFEVRDVHPTQYWRICPIHTPEWPNIWLVLHLASYAKVDRFGFITTPFQKVVHRVKNDWIEAINKISHDAILDSKWKMIIDEKSYITKDIAKKIKDEIKDDEIIVRWFVTNDYDYFDAYQERGLTIAEANIDLDEFGNLLETRIGSRKNSEPVIAYEKEVTYKDVSPKQIMSETTTLIPFLEHDDATRAEMGTNMMRQAVPLIRTESPIVGTGTERVIWEWSWYIVKAEEDWVIIGVDAKHISVLYKSWDKKLYELRTFEKSNDDMHIHQKALVSTWQKINAWDIIADWQSIENWELAIGKNLLVAYMPWWGYNYEDAIIISSRVMENDLFTSVHISEYVQDVRETKLGPEQTTDDIPNVSSTKLRNLNEDGIIRIGAHVKWWDILVGKVTPKWEIELSPEERLLRAIFGDKSKDVKDSSLILPAGTWWKVIWVHVLRREDWDNLPTWVFKQVKVFIAETRKIEVWDKMAWRHGNKWIVSRIVKEEDMPFMQDWTPVDIILNPLWVISRMNIGQILETHLGHAAKKLWIKVASPILNWLTVEQIGDLMEKAWLTRDGKVQLFDWKTWEPFKEKTMVWVKYMLKLHHLVEDKIHARSVGPYSMVTQQPLWGKAQNWGQRFWEMEVWALEWYWAANILQEMITIKSDDITGRTQSYEAIVKQKRIKRPSMPESFNVLLRELQALNLSLDLLNKEQLDAQEEEMLVRFLELEKLEWQYDIEVDTAGAEIIKDSPVFEWRDDKEDYK